MKHLCKITSENIENLNDNEVFVFGSNLAGIHGAGAALLAKSKFGAIQNIGIGLQGNSYALPTKDFNINTLPITSSTGYSIEFFVKILKDFIESNLDKHFLVTKIGCRLAGYIAEQEDRLLFSILAIF